MFEAQLTARAGSGLDANHRVRIVAIGDLHGDYEHALTILKFADVVDKDGKWSGNVDVLVQMGDVMDR